ncbi:MAG: hypothetical protein ABI831_19340, partial [Betaproteobacteria bacterium]
MLHFALARYESVSKSIRVSVLIAAFASFVCMFAGIDVYAQPTEITFQGQLQNSSAAANGNFDFEFLLFDSGGSQIGSAISRNGVAVANGIFSVNLDFGSSFPGANRFLEIRVRQSGGGAFTTLSPRQPMTSAPYSLKSLTADNAVNATTAATATNALNLGGVAANQYLQTNGNGSGLTNLNASSLTSGTLSNARLGQIPTANIADNAVTAAKIAGGQVVKGITFASTTLTDNVTLAQGNNITITPTGNTLTIASTGGGGGVSGSGTTNSIPFWSAGTTLGNSVITQSPSGVQLPNGVQLAVGAQGNALAFGSPNSETGITIGGASGRADLRYNGTLKLLNGPGGIPPETNGIAITADGNVGIGTTAPFRKLDVRASNGTAVSGQSTTTGVSGVANAATGTTVGVYGQSSSMSGIGVWGNAISVSGITYGVYGESSSSAENASGVYGIASAATGVTYGGRF